MERRRRRLPKRNHLLTVAICGLASATAGLHGLSHLVLDGLFLIALVGTVVLVAKRRIAAKRMVMRGAGLLIVVLLISTLPIPELLVRPLQGAAAALLLVGSLRAGRAGLTGAGLFGLPVLLLSTTLALLIGSKLDSWPRLAVEVILALVAFLVGRSYLVNGQLLLALNSDDFEKNDEIYVENEEPTPHLDRKRPDIDPLGKLPLFAALPAHHAQAIRDQIIEVRLEAGDYLFKAGEPSNAAFVIQTGKVALERDGVVISELGRGAALGELGHLMDAPYPVSARALRASTIVKIPTTRPGTDVEDTMIVAMAKSLASRLQDLQPEAEDEAQEDVVVAVISLDRRSHAREYGEQLKRDVGRFLKADTIDQITIQAIANAEAVNDVIILCVDVDWDISEREVALRAADRLVAVMSEPVDDYSHFSVLRGADLVVSTHISQDDLLLAIRAIEPKSVHRVRDLSTDLRPLAARIAGRSLGLVLGGGGARGLAHIGVVEEIEAAGFRVDRVAGTSMGAIIAGSVALLPDAASVDAAMYDGLVRQSPVSGDYGLPKSSLLRGRRTDVELRKLFGENLIETLPKEFRCVSVDLLNRRAVTHSSGRLADAVACSLRLPAIFPPYELGGTLHIDGGVLNNLPVDALDPREGPIVAVDVGAIQAPIAQGSDGRLALPGIGDVLMRTIMLASDTAAENARNKAAVLIRPDTSDVSLLEFDRIDDMRKVGRAAAREAIPAIASALK